MDISNLIIRYRQLAKECQKSYPNRNPLAPMLIELYLMIIYLLFVGTFQFFERGLWFNLSAFVSYVILIIILIVICKKRYTNELVYLKSYFEPNASYRIRSLIVLLLEHNLDYRSEHDIDNLIHAIDYQREESFRLNKLIPNWMWSAIISPIFLHIFNFFVEFKKEKIVDNIVDYIYAIFLIASAIVIFAGTIVIWRRDDYKDMKHDLIQIKTFNKYYSEYDDVYHRIIEEKKKINTDKEGLDSLYDLLRK